MCPRPQTQKQRPTCRSSPQNTRLQTQASIVTNALISPYFLNLLFSLFSLSFFSLFFCHLPWIRFFETRVQLLRLNPRNSFDQNNFSLPSIMNSIPKFGLWQWQHLFAFLQHLKWAESNRIKEISISRGLNSQKFCTTKISRKPPILYLLIQYLNIKLVSPQATQQAPPWGIWIKATLLKM